jgi:hypothetical protein
LLEGRPDLQLSTNTLDFGTTRSEATFTVTNDSKDNALTSGVAALDYQLKPTALGHHHADVGHCDGEQSVTHTVTVDRSGMPDGQNLATITATSNGGSDHITVRVTTGAAVGAATNPRLRRIHRRRRGDRRRG